MPNDFGDSTSDSSDDDEEEYTERMLPLVERFWREPTRAAIGSHIQKQAELCRPLRESLIRTFRPLAKASLKIGDMCLSLGCTAWTVQTPSAAAAGWLAKSVFQAAWVKYRVTARVTNDHQL